MHIVAATRLQLVYINSVLGANRLWGESSVGRNVHGRNAHKAKRLWGEIDVLPWGEVSMGRNVRGAKSPDTAYFIPVKNLTPRILSLKVTQGHRN